MAYEHPSGLPGAYDRSGAFPHFTGLVHKAGDFVQAAEANEAQTIMRRRLQRIGNMVARDGDRVFGAQAEGCSPVSVAYKAGVDAIRPVKPDTIAKSLAIGDPADGPYAVEQARRTGGTVDMVNDDEIRAGIRLLAETTGIFTETAGGVTVGVLKKLADRGDLVAGEKVVVYITGEGLKTLDANRESFAFTTIDPDPDSFEAKFGQEVAV